MLLYNAQSQHNNFLILWGLFLFVPKINNGGIIQKIVKVFLLLFSH